MTTKHPSHIYIDRKGGTVSILVAGKWWKLPLDQEKFREIFREYVEVQRVERGEDTVEDYMITE
jgi:predicted urease superfamily metal-dependent hydrolase